MIFRTLNNTGDWTFGRGNVDYAPDERAIELNLLTAIKSWKGNCFFDHDAGIDWTARLDKGQKENLVAELKSLIIKSYGIVAVNSVEIVEAPNTRAITVYINVDTIYSPSFTAEVAIAAGVPA
jgi:hypothetical protein